MASLPEYQIFVNGVQLNYDRFTTFHSFDSDVSNIHIESSKAFCNVCDLDSATTALSLNPVGLTMSCRRCERVVTMAFDPGLRFQQKLAELLSNVPTMGALVPIRNAMLTERERLESQLDLLESLMRALGTELQGSSVVDQ